ncbi:MAG: hypothetical protein ACN6O7_09830 [Sphingobacterium sp.]
MQARAQQLEIEYFFLKDTVTVEREATFSNVLLIKNHSDQVVKLRTNPSVLLEISMLKVPSIISLKAGEEKSIPFKFYAENSLISQQFEQFGLSLVNADNNITVGKKAFYTKIRSDRNIVIGTQNSEIYLMSGEQSTQLPIRLINNSLIPFQFTLHFEGIPEGLDIEGDRGPLLINGGEETIKNYIIRDKRMSSKSADFSVIISAIDSLGATLERKAIRIMRLSNRRSITGPEKEFLSWRSPHQLSRHNIDTL